MTFWTHLVETYPRHIHTKFEMNLADGFWEDVKNVNCVHKKDDGRTDDGGTDDGSPPILEAQLTDKWAELEIVEVDPGSTTA